MAQRTVPTVVTLSEAVPTWRVHMTLRRHKTHNNLNKYFLISFFQFKISSTIYSNTLMHSMSNNWQYLALFCNKFFFEGEFNFFPIFFLLAEIQVLDPLVQHLDLIPIMFYINFYIISSIYFIYLCFPPGQTTIQNLAHSLLIDIWVYEQNSSWQTPTISAWSCQPKFDPISGLRPTWWSCAIISAKKIGLHNI